MTLDLICLVHGLHISKHQCLYCCLCYTPLTPETCNVREDGQREDVCQPRAEAEKARMTR